MNATETPLLSEHAHPLQRDWKIVGGSGEIEDLLQILAVIPGIVLSPDRLVRFGVALSLLADQGGKFEQAIDAARVASPLLATTREAQAAALVAIKHFWGTPETESPTRETKWAPVTELVAKALKRRLRLIALLIATLSIGTAAALALLPNVAKGVAVAMPSVPVSAPNAEPLSGSFWMWLGNLFYTDLMHRIFAVLATAAFAIVWWNGSRSGGKQLTRSNSDGKKAETFTPYGRGVLFPTAVVRRAGRILRRPVGIVGTRIDVLRSVKASVAAYGYPILKSALVSRTPDCLMLVERQSQSDHLSALADALAKRLRDGGADLFRYEFRSSPDVLEAVGRRFGGHPVLSLAALARRHPGARVIVVSTGRGFFEPYRQDKLRLERHLFGEAEDSPFVDCRLSGFGAAKQKRILPGFCDPPILLTPTPADSWGPAERALEHAGFSVISLASTESPEIGLEIAAESIVKGCRSMTVDRNVIENATVGYHPLLQAFDRPELLSEIAPPSPAKRDQLARQMVAYACARLGEAVEGELPEDPYAADGFLLQAAAGLTALALFPRLDANFTPSLWAIATGHEASAARLARLSRLPWFRTGYMPNWLRSAIAQYFKREIEMEDGSLDRWEQLQAALAEFANRCIVGEATSVSIEVFRRYTPIEELRARFDLLLSNTSPAMRSLLEDRLFLTFLREGKVEADELVVELPPVDRPTQMMWWGATAFGIVALVAAVFLPWGLRALNAWPALPTREDVPHLFIILLSINIVFVAALFLIGNMMVETYRRILEFFFIFFNIMSYPVSTIFFLSLEIPPEIGPLSLVYFQFSSLFFILSYHVRTFWPLKFEQTNAPQMAYEYKLELILIPVLMTAIITFDVKIQLYSGLVLCAIALCMPSTPYRFFLFVSLFTLNWQFLCLNSVADEIIGFGIFIYSDVVVISLLLCCAFSAIVALESDGARGSQWKRFLIIWMSVVIAAMATGSGLVSLQYVSMILHLVSGSIIMFCGWIAITTFRGGTELFLTSARRGVLRSVAKAKAFGRIPLRLRWADFALQGFLIAVIYSALQVTASSALTWLGVPPWSSLLSTFVATFVLCLLAIAAYPEPQGRSARKDTMHEGSLWWIVPALWGIAIFSASLPDWISYLESTNSLVVEISAAFEAFNHPFLSPLPYLALPAAVFFAKQGRSEIDKLILIGLMPFLLSYDASYFATPGGVWIITLTMAILQIVRNVPARRQLLSFGGGFGERPPNPFLIFLIVFALLALLTLNVYGESEDEAILLNVEPGPFRMALVFLLGIMPLPQRPVLLALAAHSAMSLYVSLNDTALDGDVGDVLAWRLGDTDVLLGMVLLPVEAIDLWLAYLIVPLFRRAASAAKDTSERALRVFVISIISCIATGVALALTLNDGTYDVGFIEYFPSGLTVPVLALMVGVVASMLSFVWLFYLTGIIFTSAVVGAVLGQVEGGVGGLSTGVVTLFCLPLIVGFMLLGRAAGAALPRESRHLGTAGPLSKMSSFGVEAT